MIADCVLSIYNAIIANKASAGTPIATVKHTISYVSTAGFDELVVKQIEVQLTYPSRFATSLVYILKPSDKPRTLYNTTFGDTTSGIQLPVPLTMLLDYGSNMPVIKLRFNKFQQLLEFAIDDIAYQPVVLGRNIYNFDTWIQIKRSIV